MEEEWRILHSSSDNNLLKLLGEVERRYRTVLDAPDNDDNLKELQKIGEKIIDLQTSEPAAVIRQKKF